MTPLQASVPTITPRSFIGVSFRGEECVEIVSDKIQPFVRLSYIDYVGLS